MKLELDTLNPPQLAAVTYDGPNHCLILAGAGSGKTRVLTHRIAWLISQGVAPKSILAITFTNKAAREMRERALALIGDENDGVQLSTFHAFGAKFLRQFATYAHLEPTFSIYGESEQKTMLKGLMQKFNIIGPDREEQLDGEQKKDSAMVSDTLDEIMAWKERGTSVETAMHEARNNAQRQTAMLYEAYERQLIQNNAVDFAGLLLWPLHILLHYENVRERVRSRYQHILVDEFQDTNGVQLRLLKALCGAHTRLTVVGDDDQSIYTWRGADPTAILEFEDKFGLCDTFKLEQNYRSTQPILNCAGNLIAHNRERTEKRLWTSLEGGAPVTVLSFESDWDEASTIIERMTSRRSALRLSWENIAVLYRRNSQSVSFERECTQRGIPYQVIGGTGFYEREEIVDLIAYLRVLVNPADTMSLRRIINKPVRGIGEKSAEKIIELMEKKGEFGLTPTQCLLGLLDDIVAGRCKVPRGGAKVVTGCQALLRLFERVSDWKNRAPRDTLIDIIDEIDFKTHLKKAAAAKNQDFSDIEARLSSLIQELEAHQQKSPYDLPGFLETSALIRPESDDAKRALNLMTIHSAKGLEFELVYIVGAGEGVLPLSRGGECDVEEERRLMYVAMTRARRELTISYAEQRHEYGRVIAQDPSRFFEEMETNDASIRKEHLDASDRKYGKTPQLAWSRPNRAQRKSQSSTGFSDEVGGGRVRSFRSPSPFDGLEPGFEMSAVDIFGDIEPKSSNSDSKYPHRHATGSKHGHDSASHTSSACGSASATSKNGKPIQVGTRVKHAIHGTGTVTALEKSGNDFKATIEFSKSGKRIIIARFLEV